MARIVYRLSKSTGLIAAQRTSAMQTLGVLDNDVTLWGVAVWSTKVIPDGDGDVEIELFDRNAPVIGSFTAFGHIGKIKVPMSTLRYGTESGGLHGGGAKSGDLNAAGSPSIFPIIYRDADAQKRLNYVVYNPKNTAETFGVEWFFSKRAES